MLITIFGESCTGKSTLADALKERTGAQVYSGKDYLRLAKSEGMAKALFQKQLKEAAAGEGDLIYVIAEPELLALVPDGGVRVLVTAELPDIKARFAAQMCIRDSQRAGPVVAAAFFLFLASLGGACLGCGLSFGLLGLGRFLLGLFLAVLSLRLARRTAAPVGGIASLAPTRQGRWFGTDGPPGGQQPCGGVHDHIGVQGVGLVEVCGGHGRVVGHRVLEAALADAPVQGPRPLMDRLRLTRLGRRGGGSAVLCLAGAGLFPAAAPLFGRRQGFLSLLGLSLIHI